MTNLNELLKNTSRSLYLSARLLPTDVRDTFCIAYLLCRYADSIADTSLISSEKRLYWIKKFPEMIIRPNTRDQEQLVAEISGSSSNIYEEKLLHNFPLCLQAFNVLSEKQKETILEVVHAVCDGMKIDLEVFPPENTHQIKSLKSTEELEHYCHLMGGAPGVFWSKLILSHVKVSVDEKEFLSLGKDIGDAEQIVNILRDLPRDLRIGRCYFPEEDLQQYGLSAEDLLNEKNSLRFEPIKQKWIEWGRAKLNSAKKYFSAIPKTQLKHRAAVAWPVLWAGDTLNKISSELNLLDNSRRVKIARSRIYLTMAATPPILMCDKLFNVWLNKKLSNKKDL